MGARHWKPLCRREYLSDLGSPPPPRRLGLWAGAVSREENGSAGNWCPSHGEACPERTCSRWRTRWLRGNQKPPQTPAKSQHLCLQKPEWRTLQGFDVSYCCRK
nr:unnamed protein product [Mus musculus]